MFQQQKNPNQKPECLNLFWLCTRTNRKYPAGVAFYNEDQGDYSLKVDFLPEEKVLFLKPIGSTAEKTDYRVEVAVRKSGKVIHRAEMGTGHAKRGESTLHMDLGPFDRPLIMEQRC